MRQSEVVRCSNGYWSGWVMWSIRRVPFGTRSICASGTMLFIALPKPRTWEAERRAFLWIACSPGVSVTICEAEIPALDNIVQQYSDGMRFHTENTSVWERRRASGITLILRSGPMQVFALSAASCMPPGRLYSGTAFRETTPTHAPCTFP